MIINQKQQMSILKLESWIRGLERTKPYRIMLKNGLGFYEILLIHNQYHSFDRIWAKDMEDENECQKKILQMCINFENHIKDNF